MAAARHIFVPPYSRGCTKMLFNLSFCLVPKLLPFSLRQRKLEKILRDFYRTKVGEKFNLTPSNARKAHVFFDVSAALSAAMMTQGTVSC
jgi:hypothetical protein